METNNPRRKKQSSFEIKKEAVEELEKGIYSEQYLCSKYKIIPKTLRNWQEQVNRGVKNFRKRTKITDAVKRKAVREIQSGAITIAEARAKYGVRDKGSIREWIKAFSSDICDIIPLPMPQSEKDQIEQSAIEQRCKELENALSQAHLKIAGLETLIDVAEKELHIEIRKKPGTKQS
jgi:transposase-like protein